LGATDSVRRRDLRGVDPKSAAQAHDLVAHHGIVGLNASRAKRTGTMRARRVSGTRALGRVGGVLDVTISLRSRDSRWSGMMLLSRSPDQPSLAGGDRGRQLTAERSRSTSDGRWIVLVDAQVDAAGPVDPAAGVLLDVGL
jgi:hypothetical protein